MKKIAVEITGTTPLMMHNPSAMRGAGGGKKQIPSAEDEAKASRYLATGSSEQMIVLPDHIHSCIKVASRGFRISGREQVYPYICGSIEIQPEEIPVQATGYEVDTRRVVVQRQGIMRSRAKLWPWSTTFELLYDEESFTERFMDGVLRDQIFKRAGTAVGLLEYRPAKGGRFGRFVVTGWDR